MYIDPVIRKPRIFRGNSALSAFVANAATAAIMARGMPCLLVSCALLSGCLGPESRPITTISKPETLHPDADAFSKVSTRDYLWMEYLRRAGESDSLLLDLPLRAVRSGDAVSGDSLRLTSISYTGPVAPAAALARLGFQPARFRFDSSLILDPGPGLPFPVTPVLGWRLDTVVGELRFVRSLHRVETIQLGDYRHECWAFAESTYTLASNADTAMLLGTGTSCMGRTGLVRHVSVWTGFTSSAATAGSLYREITAQ